ncbi:uncharacterized protein NPIL_195362 [Nephila pilipes]|uniref:Uncharacterized protein n=1 Tax=Nephila pilipes TaxID=299642 RepID=A0A8X6U6U5_NEPPI|nr:uncharacterized protein NPIL_195362 [Nephila pilipes]
MMGRPPWSALCPYTTLFRSVVARAQPEAACMRFHWPSFQVLNQPQPDEDKDKVESQSSNFLTVPGPVAGSSGGCHNSTDSVNSCASTRCIVEICRNESFSDYPTRPKSKF